MTYSKDYFSLQIEFAQKAMEFTKQSLEDSLLEFTGFYKTFRISGWTFDKENLTWARYIKAISKSNNIVDATYNFYLKRLEGPEQQDVNISKQFGCFSYEISKEENCVYMHFRNLDGATPGPLSKEHRELRAKELTEMFKDIKNTHPEIKVVAGFSWLYNIEAYKRLFPREYTENMTQTNDWFKSSAIWGQFIDSAGELKTVEAAKFRANVANSKSLNELKKCFPLKLLEPKAKIDYFYEKYLPK